ncbi:MAG: hypothetical protein ACPG7S_01510 [Miltoncostaeaceae bacterium]
MSTERDVAAMRRVIAMTGLSFPRGLLGGDAMAFTEAAIVATIIICVWSKRGQRGLLSILNQSFALLALTL